MRGDCEEAEKEERDDKLAMTQRASDSQRKALREVTEVLKKKPHNGL